MKIVSCSPTPLYTQGWDRIFGKGEPEPPTQLSVEALRIRAKIRRKIRSSDDRIAKQLEWAADEIERLQKCLP
jgi:hypothetical protein